MKTTLNDFLERAFEAHGNRYDYSKVDYHTTEKKVIIICKEHGEFPMRPRAHYADKRGCPDCYKGGKSGFHNSEWAKNGKYFYLVELQGQGERFLKYGVTINGVEERFQKGQMPYSYKVIFEQKLADGEKAMKTKKLIKLKYSNWSYLPNTSFRGASQCIEQELKSKILKELRELF